jgi:translocation and assembly module TamA
MWRVPLSAQHRLVGAAGLAAVLLAPPVPVWAQVPEPAAPAAVEDDASQPDPETAIRYVLNVRGLDGTGLAERFRALSILAANERRGSASRFRLEGWLRQDEDTLEKLLRAEGYYGAGFTVQLAPAPGLKDSLVVLLLVVPGQPYSFRSISAPESQADLMATLKALGISTGARARAEPLTQIDSATLQSLRQAGHAFATVQAPDVLVDHAAGAVDVTVQAEPGPVAQFGAIRATDPVVLPADHLVQVARFRPGQPYRADRVEDLRQALLATGLYATLSVQATPSPDDPAVADITVSGVPARRRSVSISGGYGTSEGPKVEASWQHRNLFGREERLTILGRAGTQDQRLSADLRRYNFGRRDRTLLGTLALGREQTDAFTTQSLALSGGLERETELLWQKRWVYALLARAELARVDEAVGRSRQPGDRDTFTLLSLPATLRYDGTTDLLDPRSGFRLSGTLEPELSIRGRTNAYLRVDLAASIYQPVDLGREVILAARLRMGTIAGASLDQIAATRRFYSGGGGSVRGFGFQGVGPQDADGQPEGGRSLAEVSFEARIAVTPTIGVVPFLDGGMVDGSALPDFGSLRWGAGLGLRYNAGFGPLRIDLATPISSRRTGDARVSVYVSVGQSF